MLLFLVYELLSPRLPFCLANIIIFLSLLCNILPSRSLYVKNLSFKASDESLKKHFSEKVKEGKLLSVKVKKHLKNGNNISMGFGFLEFDSVETFTNVCRDLQGTILDGNAFVLQLCHAKKDEVPKKVDKDKSSTKQHVKKCSF